MKTLKIAAAALIIAGGTFGAFAFTKAEKTEKKGKLTNYTFVHPNHNSSLAKSQFIYDPTPGNCSTSSNVCTAVWSQSEVPTEGESPSSDATLISMSTGNYTP
ncbi:hypothetical protein [Chryseobacterium sp. MEBOG07]|uniref:hypothetical protein n=1 Tax=Chryseobacterium sp. MEBOG07 TaxID=2879939 RepID=UPI001F2A635E|nr:hypothetical protein [Chryseobacterium sp. MEBOG07]UKB78573.1 hypothetical protein LF886_19195 [Chryseobacterium sp. MEBOG07]